MNEKTPELQLLIEDEVYDVVGLEGREAISELFWFDLDVTSLSGGDMAALATGANATLVFLRDGAVCRRVHGFIEHARRRIDAAAERPAHRVRLVPTAARARLVETQRVFLNISVPALIKEKLALLGLAEKAVSMVDAAPYPQREFVVQFQETDLAFISRLSEHLGISFFFEHLDDTDQIVFVDDNAGFTASAQAPSVSLTDNLNEPDHIYRLDVLEEVVPTNYVAYDYNYRRPDLSLVGMHAADEGAGGGYLEYGCHIKDEAQGKALAKIRAEERLCRRRRYVAESSIVNMTAGGKTTLEARGDLSETSLLITAVHHRLGLRQGTEGVQQVYDNTFEAVETQHTFRPQRVTPRPRIAGFVTGTVRGLPNVVAEGAESAVLDPEGRYSVQLHFDNLLGDPSKSPSHPIRMSQPFGGTGHGMHFPLRPGTEVAVAFAGGDPDRPVIIGAIPNAHTRTPVTASNSTQNRITTASGAIFEISERR